MSQRRPGGTYLLVLRLPEGKVIAIGKLGHCPLPEGFYVYVGSALGGLSARLSRHLRRGKVHRWHIDYLLEEAHLVEIRAEIASERRECQWAEALGSFPTASIPIPGFGSSDCSCPSHLFHFPSRPDFEEFGQKWTIPI